MKLFLKHEWEYARRFVGQFPASSNIPIGYLRSDITVYNLYKERVQCYENSGWKFCEFKKSIERLEEGQEFARFVYHR